VDDLPSPKGHYAHATGWENLVFISGQLPDLDIGSEASFESQVRSAVSRLLLILQAAGSTPFDLLKVSAYLVGIERWPEFNAIYAELLGPVTPARVVVPVPALHYGWLIEVDAIAIRRTP
jgi:enamine deaminase RidA (YjgF/YER057c/UK114 family)